MTVFRVSLQAVDSAMKDKRYNQLLILNTFQEFFNRIVIANESNVYRFPA